MTRIFFCGAALALLSLPLGAAQRTSADYTVPTETLDAGGAPSASTAYVQSAGSLGVFGGVQTSTAYTGASSFLGATAEPADTTPPVIATPGDLMVMASTAAGAVVTFLVSASDAVSGATVATAIPASGSTFPIGTTTVNVSATDAAGNTDTVSFSVTVTATPAQIWRQQHFGTMENSSSAADTADPDGDGLTNLQERAFGLNPMAGGAGFVSVSGGVITPGLPATSVAQAQYSVNYRAMFSRPKDAAASGLTYTVQFSTNLGTWTTTTVTPTVVADDGVMQVVTVPYPLSIGGKKPQFFRVSVTQQ